MATGEAWERGRVGEEMVRSMAPLKTIGLRWSRKRWAFPALRTMTPRPELRSGAIESVGVGGGEVAEEGREAVQRGRHFLG